MLSQLTTLITNLVRAPSGQITADQLTEAVGLALQRYQADKPRQACDDVYAGGGLELPLPVAWEASSELRTIEYPIGRFPVEYIPANQFALVDTPDGPAIRLAAAVNAGEQMRVTFTIEHQLDDTHDTIPAAHREAFCCWAAGILCDQIAGEMASNTAPTIGADSADTANPAREWRTRANGFRARYAALLGIQGVTGQSGDKPQNKAAGTVTEISLDDSRDRGWYNRYRT